MASGYTGELAKLLHDLTGSVYFVIKQVRPSHVAEKTNKRNCTLMMPVWFVKEHGDKFHRTVALRSRKCMEPLMVQLCVQSCKTSLKPSKSPPEIRFGKGWKAFATRNELSVGDSLVFELTDMSEFVVHIVRKTASVPSSHAPETLKPSVGSTLSQKNGSNDSGAPEKQYEFSQKNGNGSSGAGNCGISHHRPASESSEGETVDDLCNWIAKKRKIGHDQDDASAALGTILNSSMCMNSHPLESDNLQASKSSEASQASQSSLKQPPPGAEPEKKAKTTTDVHVLPSPHTLTSFPTSFTQRLVDYNTHDSAGNTCGARFEVPSGSLETHGVRLQPHEKLQGIRGDSPVRTVTCSGKEGEDGGRWLAWGDFVRENGLRAGQELAFIMTSDSSFLVREAFDIGDK